ncbi:hypothetical protein B0H17DRAFT_1129392 [Mycena rosella]|uniref:Uncharacterized protein n=1 Tax=Mycena rosella TaxID=1033263 RepID=A0AAD7DUN5_MYCRO|nr:hypothetical protein B0H17DRAFT_1129392 [Mycena rosella]
MVVSTLAKTYSLSVVSSAQMIRRNGRRKLREEIANVYVGTGTRSTWSYPTWEALGESTGESSGFSIAREGFIGRRVTTRATCSKSAKRDRSSSTWGRGALGSQGVSKLSNARRCLTNTLEKLKSHSGGYGVPAESIDQNISPRYRDGPGWSSANLARQISPIPPAPRIARLGESGRRRPTTAANSESRPWNICGALGSISGRLLNF